MATAVPDFVAPSPAYPQAPTAEAWARMTPQERRRVVDELPAALTDAECLPSEGDLHFDAKVSARDVLRKYFKKFNPKVYIASELTVYYPGEPRFSPDLLAVLDVETHQRMKWVVSAEGKGLDFVLEVHVAGDKRKDSKVNVERYARLGIPEYFIFDRAGGRLHGYRLPNVTARVYQPIVPQAGRYESNVLGLELVLEGDRLRFQRGNALLLEADELIRRLEENLERAEASSVQRAREAEERLHEFEQRARKTQRSILQRIVAARGLTLSEAEQARIEGCEDIDVINRWIDAALSATSTAEIFINPPDTPA